MRTLLLLLLPLLVASQASIQGERAEEEEAEEAGSTAVGRDPNVIEIRPRQGECVYTFTVVGDAHRDSCRTAEVERLVQSLRQEYDQVKADNTQLHADLQAIRDDYQAMVETVARLETETASWREVIEWPAIPIPFEPDNASLIISREPSYKDCWAAKQASGGKAGIYSLQPDEAVVPFFGFCDQDGWTVFQRRFNGDVDFYRSWQDYAKGFGHLSGEFWLGNEQVHLLTKQDDYELRVEVVGYNGKLYYGNYDKFAVQSELDEYALEISNMTTGNYMDELAVLDGQGFCTFDHDNDNWYQANCAEYYRGGFWLNNCGSDINRLWCNGGGCMSWGERQTIVEKSLLKIRPVSAAGGGGRGGGGGGGGGSNSGRNAGRDQPSGRVDPPPTYHPPPTPPPNPYNYDGEYEYDYDFGLEGEEEEEEEEAGIWSRRNKRSVKKNKPAGEN